MITFSKSSWHYRLHIWIHGDEYPEDLCNFCTYVWRTISAMILAPIVYVLERTSRYPNEPELKGVVPKPCEPHQPNILVEYLKAKKNRYCPVIDWSDD